MREPNDIYSDLLIAPVPRRSPTSVPTFAERSMIHPRPGIILASAPATEILMQQEQVDSMIMPASKLFSSESSFSRELYISSIQNNY
jgi:hypothetical protein